MLICKNQSVTAGHQQPAKLGGSVRSALLEIVIDLILPVIQLSVVIDDLLFHAGIKVIYGNVNLSIEVLPCLLLLVLHLIFKVCFRTVGFSIGTGTHLLPLVQLLADGKENIAVA